MVKEIEILTAEGVGGLWRRVGKRRPAPVGSECLNCGAVLAGRYCHECGQSSDLRHRSILHLLGEAPEGLFHADGRLWRTLPALFFRPGVLGKDYLEGRIARHVPPLRMFLVSLLIFIFAAEHWVDELRRGADHLGMRVVAVSQGDGGRAGVRIAETGAVSPEGLAQAVRAEGQVRYVKAVAKAEKDRGRALVDPAARAGAQHAHDLAVADAQAARAADLRQADLIAQGKAIPGQVTGLASESGRQRLAEQLRKSGKPGEGGAVGALRRGAAAALDSPDYYLAVLFTWAHRLAVLLLPITAAWLALLYAHRRKFFVHDHLIIAMDFLSFLFLAYAVGLVLPAPLAGPWFWIVVLWTPVNLFMTLRGAYGSSVAGAAVKAVAISVATSVTFLALLVVLGVFVLFQL
jgi:hypothetical protein